MRVVDLLYIGILVIAILFFGNMAKEHYQEYKLYDEFCDERPNFCYCAYLECEFKTSSSQKCVNGDCSEVILSEDTKSLCDLAEELNDEKVMFKTGCYSS